MESKKRGRPAKEVARSHIVRTRLSDEELRMFDEIQERTGMTKSNILRAAIRVYYYSNTGKKVTF